MIGLFLLFKLLIGNESEHCFCVCSSIAIKSTSGFLCRCEVARQNVWRRNTAFWLHLRSILPEWHVQHAKRVRLNENLLGNIFWKNATYWSKRGTMWLFSQNAITDSKFQMSLQDLFISINMFSQTDVLKTSLCYLKGLLTLGISCT